MASLFDESDDEEPFFGFTREEQDRLCQEWGEEESVDETLSDEMDDSDDGEEQDSDELRWNESFDDEQVQCFNQHVGPTRRLPQIASVLDYFLVLFIPALLETITDNTNRYAIETDLDSEEMRGDISRTFVAEIKALLGVVILMGIIQLPKISLYWSKDERFYQPAVAKVFSRDRFLELLKYFHVSDTRTLPEQSDPERKLYRTKPVMEVLALTFQEMYSPHCEQAIDEAMVKFKGRVGFLQ